MNCIICNRKIELNEYIVVVSIKKHKFICGDCAINNWHYYDLTDNFEQENEYEPFYEEDSDDDYLDYMEWCDDVWEQSYGPDVPYGAICSICNEQIADESSSLIFTHTYNKNDKFYHEDCLKWPFKYYEDRDFKDNFEEFFKCKSNEEIINLIKQDFIAPYKLKEVI